MSALRIARNQLLEPLTHAVGLIEKRQTLPILANVHVRVEGGRMVLTATDLELQATTALEVEHEGDWAFTVGGRKLLDICRSSGAEASLEMRQQGDAIEAHAENSRYRLQTLPVEDYPQMRLKEETRAELRLPAGRLREALGRVHYAMASQDIRYYLNGLLLSPVAGRLTLVATDGHRLAWKEMEADGSEQAPAVILPRKAVLELLRMLPEGEEPVRAAIGQTQALFEFGNVTLISKLIEGKYPDFERVIPASPQHSARAARATLLTALQRAAILSSDKVRGVRLQFEEGSCRVSCTNGEREEANATLGLLYSGPAVEIGFNVTYLTEVMLNSPAAEVELYFSDAQSSMLVKDADAGDFKYVVMPMRL